MYYSGFHLSNQGNLQELRRMKTKPSTILITVKERITLSRKYANAVFHPELHTITFRTLPSTASSVKPEIEKAWLQCLVASKSVKRLKTVRFNNSSLPGITAQLPLSNVLGYCLTRLTFYYSEFGPKTSIRLGKTLRSLVALHEITFSCCTFHGDISNLFVAALELPTVSVGGRGVEKSETLLRLRALENRKIVRTNAARILLYPLMTLRTSNRALLKHIIAIIHKIDGLTADCTVLSEVGTTREFGSLVLDAEYSPAS